jgi:hypothetical protein
MRKLLLTTTIVLLTTSAFAGPRGLSAPQPAEPQKPFRQAEVTILPAPGEQPAAATPQAAPQTMQEKLKAAGELKSDGTPATRPVAAPAPVQPAPAPVQAQPAPTPAQTQATTVQAQPVQKPARKRVVHKRESGEQKARRIAARFGIYW